MGQAAAKSHTSGAAGLGAYGVSSSFLPASLEQEEWATPSAAGSLQIPLLDLIHEATAIEAKIRHEGRLPEWATPLEGS
jgi:hypothetical protein